MQGSLYAERLKVFVVDEVHCVKKWIVLRNGKVTVERP